MCAHILSGVNIWNVNSCSKPTRWVYPACAGEPGQFVTTSRPEKVYPRVCGGTALKDLLTPFLNGLSPRVRGNRLKGLANAFLERSIPACAGEPVNGGHPTVLHGVYPRVCGGTTTMSLRSGPDMGLSPRVRGNPSLYLVHHPSATVYPRVCGGTTYSRNDAFLWMGLSPRVRGEPRSNSLSVSMTSVYPRVCGGTSCAGQAKSNRHGLSPRVRGNHVLSQRRLPVDGSIPACAGEPIRR